MLRRLDHQRRGAFGAGLWSFADQALVSLANFLLTVLLARNLSAYDFGIFVLIYLMLVIGQNIQMALIARPHNLLAAGLRPETYRYYTSAMARAQFLLAGVLVLPVLPAAALSYYFNFGVTQLLLLLGGTLIAYQLQEFLRQERYTVGRSQDAFAYDVIAYGGQIALLVALALTDHLTGRSAMLVLGVTSGLSAVYGFWRTGIRPGTLSSLVMVQNWRTGRWILGDNAGQWLSDEMFPFVIAAFAGPAGSAAFRALKNVVAPTHVVFQALQSFALPRAARAFEQQGVRGLLWFLLPTALLVGVPFAVFLAGVSFVGQRVLDLLYGAGHGFDARLLWLFAAAYMVQYVTQGAVMALYVLNNGRSVLAGRLASIGIALTAGVWLTWTFGVAGALGAILAAKIGMALVLAWLLRERLGREVRVMRRGPSTGLASAGGEP